LLFLYNQIKFLFLSTGIEIDPDLAAAYRSRDSVLDKKVDDRGKIDDYELAEHLAAVRVALFFGEKEAA
jgi:hypothetical protein